ncbi:MAG: hypothetical protein NTY02_08185, partial [Acidobacteria bacterium]|nr:hypothetical protein [Acidobacteriota bacterium]
MLATCTRMTVPESDAGATDVRTRCNARIGEDSAPWVPATSTSTGPGFAPWMIEIGMVVPASPGPAGTFRSPDTSVPGAAVIPP